MTTKLFTASAAATTKQVVVGFRQSGINYSGKEIKIGLGRTLLKFTGWNPDAIVAAWLASEDTLLSEVIPSIPSASDLLSVSIPRPPSSSPVTWVQPILFTAVNPGEDFRITLLIDGETELIYSEVQRLNFNATSGTFTLTFTPPLSALNPSPSPETTASITFSRTPSILAANIQAALDLLPSLIPSPSPTPAPLTVSPSPSFPSGTPTNTPVILLTFGGIYSLQHIPLIEVDSASLDSSGNPTGLGLLLDGAVATLIRTEGTVGSNSSTVITCLVPAEYEYSTDTQLLSASTNPPPTQGTFRLRLTGGFTWSDPIVYNASATEVKNTFEALTQIGIGNTTCTGGPLPGTPISVSFTGQATNYSSIEVDNNGLQIIGQPPTITVTEIQAGSPGASGAPGTNAIYRLTGNARSLGGFFSMTVFTPNATNLFNLPYNISASDLQSSLEGLYGSGNIVCSGGPLPDPSNFIDIEFVGAWAEQPVSLPNIDGVNLLDGVEYSVEIVQNASGASGYDSTQGAFNAFRTRIESPDLSNGYVESYYYTCTNNRRLKFKSTGGFQLPTGGTFDLALNGPGIAIGLANIPYNITTQDFMKLLNDSQLPVYVSGAVSRKSSPLVFGRGGMSLIGGGTDNTSRLFDTHGIILSFNANSDWVKDTSPASLPTSTVLTGSYSLHFYYNNLTLPGAGGTQVPVGNSLSIVQIEEVVNSAANGIGLLGGGEGVKDEFWVGPYTEGNLFFNVTLTVDTISRGLINHDVRPTVALQPLPELLDSIFIPGTNNPTYFEKCMLATNFVGGLASRDNDSSRNPANQNISGESGSIRFSINNNYPDASIRGDIKGWKIAIAYRNGITLFPNTTNYTSTPSTPQIQEVLISTPSNISTLNKFNLSRNGVIAVIDLDANQSQLQTRYTTCYPAPSGSLASVSLVTGGYRVTFASGNFPIIPLSRISNGPQFKPTISTYQTGVLPGSGTPDILEVQRVVLTNANSGTFRLGLNSIFTALLPYDISATALASALNATGLAGPGPAPSSGFGVTSSSVGNYLITFYGTLSGSDSPLFSYINNLFSPGLSQPTIIVTTLTEGGQVTITGGISGGTFDLEITRTFPPSPITGLPDPATPDVTYLVPSVPFNSSAPEIETLIEAVIGVGTVIATGGSLPDIPISLEFIGTWANSVVTVKVIPHVTIIGTASAGVSILRRAKRATRTDHNYRLVICPGSDTLGVKRVSGANGLDKNYLYLAIQTPSGTLSSKYYPSRVDDFDGVTETEPYSSMPNLIKINFTKLTALEIQETINEAFSADVCRVTKIVHSFEHADFSATTPTASETGVAEQRFLCWYTRDVYSIVFINDWADPATISSITVQLPARAGANDVPTPGSVDIDVRDFMNCDEYTPASGSIPIFGGSTGSTGSTEPDFLGTDDSREIDSGYEHRRVAETFLMAQVNGTPLHRFEIYPITQQGISRLSWKYNVEPRNIPFLASTTDRSYLADLVADMKIRFLWVGRKEGLSVEAFPILLSASKAIDWDASNLEIKRAIEEMVPSLTSPPTISSGLPVIPPSTPYFPGHGNVEVTGSLFNSWLSDPADPDPDYPNNRPQQVPSPVSSDWDDVYHDLKVAFIGRLSELPFNEYEYELVIRREHAYGSWSDGGEAEDTLTPVGSTQEISVTSGLPLNFNPVRIRGHRYTVPLPKLQSERILLTPSDSISDFKLVIDSNEFTLTPSMTAAEVETLINATLGQVPGRPNLKSKVWTFNADPAGALPYGWNFNLLSGAYEIVPDKWIKSVVVSGLTLADGPIELEFCGWGFQYTSHETVSTSITYDPAPYEATNFPGEFRTLTTISVSWSGNLGIVIDGSLSLSSSDPGIPGPLTLDLPLLPLLPLSNALTNFLSTGASGFSPETQYYPASSNSSTTATGFQMTWEPENSPDVLSISGQSIFSVGIFTSSILFFGGIDGTLTKSDVTIGDGPSWFNSTDNWTTTGFSSSSIPSAPSSEDTLIVDDAIEPILYGFDQSASFIWLDEATGLCSYTDKQFRFVEGVKVWIDGAGIGLTPGYYYILNPGLDGTFYLAFSPITDIVDAELPSSLVSGAVGTIRLKDLVLQVYSRYSGREIGLQASRLGRFEYLPQYLSADFTLIDLGEGAGSGLSLGRFNAKGNVEIIVRLTGSSSVSNTPPLLFLTNSPDAILDVRESAEVGLGLLGTACQIGGIFVETDATLIINPDVTYNHIDSTGSVTILGEDKLISR